MVQRGQEMGTSSIADGSAATAHAQVGAELVRQLVARYADLSLGFVDAAVIACAERNGGRVLTFDLRDFGVVAAEGTITIVPAPSG